MKNTNAKDDFMDAFWILYEKKKIEVPTILSNLHAIQKIMCYMFEKNNHYIQVILSNHHGYVLQEIMVSRLKKALANDMEKEFEYTVRYQIAAILSVLEFWHMQGEEQISEERLLTLIYEISTKGVLSSLIQYTESE